MYDTLLGTFNIPIKQLYLLFFVESNVGLKVIYDNLMLFPTLGTFCWVKRTYVSNLFTLSLGYDQPYVPFVDWKQRVAQTYLHLV